MASKIEYSKDCINTKLYIPDLSDKIVLTKDWTFEIYSESRNDAFLDECLNQEFFNDNAVMTLAKDIYDKSIKNEYYMKPDYVFKRLICSNVEHYKIHNRKFTIDSGTHEFDIDWDFINANRPTVTIPAGKTIFVDRIYVRKGAADYSSITFRVEKFPIKNNRFWVKLDQTRTIEGDVYSRIR